MSTPPTRTPRSGRRTAVASIERGAESRDERKARTRRALLDTALDALRDESFTSLSLREVAKGAGIVPTAFYRHFPDMDSLGIALVDESIGSLHELLRDARANAESDAHLIRGSLRILVDHVDAHERHFRFLARERFGGSAILRKAIGLEVRMFATELAVDLARVPEIGAWPSRDIQLLADLIVTLIVATIEDLVEADDADAVAAAVEAAATQMRMVLLGVGAWHPVTPRR
ncbi:MAG: TetR family transcriptional regulator [Actinobacteria bacterium]|nr:TetR family transcriptional regulator [Actinomycetota bacterium]